MTATELDEGLSALGVLACLAVALAFVCLGFGALNVLDAKTPVQSAAEQERRREQATEARQAIDELQRENTKAEREAERLQAQIEQAQGVPASALYGKRGLGKNPQWVECTEAGAVLQPQGQRFTLEELNQSSKAFGPAIKERGYAVFLVRPGGFEAFVLARAAAAAQEVKFGFEPVDETWVLKF